MTKQVILIELPGKSAEVAELADALRSGRSEHYAHVGSNPTFGMNPAQAGFFLLIVELHFLMYDRHMSRFPRFGKQWIFIVLIAILFFMVLGLNARISEYFRLTSQRDEMQQRIDNLQATQIALETEIAYANSDKAVEEWARTFERLVQSGDQVIIPLPPPDFTPETNYLAIPIPQTREKWQVWWELLFGG